MSGLPIALVVFSLVGLAFFGFRLVTDPAGLLYHAVGALICVVVLARNGRLLLKLRSARRPGPAPSGPAEAGAAPTTRLFTEEDDAGAGAGPGRAAPLEIHQVDDQAGLDQVLRGQARDPLQAQHALRRLLGRHRGGHAVR